ncbi:bifunctional serine/threonine-protein kinase/formylglycine-generating enzyme family protein [Frateuria sp. STR12]|uniref:bifunctional serine/threonine-protein kinase/formylglycine-generating enzyme family protein n=1 Tax=Frateuria hangzhouensis TaxID=2995589 RepID=UPI002260CAA3|nr:bifunctional serine/threonine-protein kinase/formylglycine-generating enzyme family protein [Frateuria sp. STR12]MCX7514346.1 bifunctional serine/threonine-protein kinase/formylglycine-generating enzyme family protein [Frateuria sp. STR12]
MNTLAELIAAFRNGHLPFPMLLDALARRGSVPEDRHHDELALVRRLHDEGELDAEIGRVLLDRLMASQAEESTDDEPVAEFDDATVVAPAVRVATAAAAIEDDATVVAPAADRVAVPAKEHADATVVMPASRPSAAPIDEATVVKPASHGRGTDEGQITGTQGTTGGSSSSSFNSASWERLAGAEVGDHAHVGMLLKGRFQLEREIGRGGMGVVFLARDERKVEARDRDPYVAVKVLNDEFRRHPDSLIALQRESRRSQSLAHDNIVRVYDFDKDRTIVYMTMEYVDGSDLKTLIRERAYNGMPLAKARPLLEGMAWALKRAHAAGVVHSDFKPGNVMVTREGSPKVFDFGIARAGKHLGEAVGEETVFDAGTLGALTPAYASLEMIQGGEPSPSDDLYALGCVAFELLTGKHPFDKVSAEVAMREGRTPPPVPGLTRRQYKTLCDAVAFRSENRLRTASEFVEGMREVGLRERIGSYLVWGAGALVVLVAGGWGATHYLHQRKVAQVIAGFAPDDVHRYADEAQAMAALDTLGEEERKRIVLDQGELIQRFLLTRLDAYWNPAQGRYDYARAQQLFALRDQLKLYSPELDIRRSAMEQQKNELLNSLDTQLSQRVEKGAIFADQPGSAIETLEKIRDIDPTSSLLKNAELELKYDIAIGGELAQHQPELAAAHLKQALALFPDSMRLQRRQAQLEAMGGGTAVTAAPVASAATSLPEARAALAALIAHPQASADWQRQVAAAVAPLKGDGTPPTAALLEQLATAIADVAGQQTDPLHLPQDLALVDFGMTVAPQSAALKARHDQLAALDQQQQERLAQESAAAEVTARIESVKRAAAAGDTNKAQESLARIRKLAPQHPFLGSEGPQLLADAYLGQAREAFRKGRYQSASDVLARASGLLGQRADLAKARARYGLAADLVKARGHAVDGADLDRLHRQLAQVRLADADALAALEAEMKLRGQLGEGSLSALLDSLKPASAAATAPEATTPAPTGGNAAAPSATHAAPTGPAKSVADKGSPAVIRPAPATATAAPSVDPCAAPSLVGAGRACFDSIAGKRGPALVVVRAGGKAIAMTRSEITINEYNRYCAATGKCSAIALEDRYTGSLPVSNISLAQARAYAAWLGSASGHVYRLPTDAEWLAAARAGGAWKQAPDSNCVPPTAGADDGSGAPIAARGRSPNPWGLINLTGNVWEWVTDGGGTAVRGGSYTSYWSDCTVDSRRSDSGGAQKDVGLRLVREVP